MHGEQQNKTCYQFLKIIFNIGISIHLFSDKKIIFEFFSRPDPRVDPTSGHLCGEKSMTFSVHPAKFLFLFRFIFAFVCCY